MAEKEGEEAVEPCCKIEVRGYKVATEDDVETYFKTTMRSGDKIVEFDPVNTDGVIFITFASEEVARRVAERLHVLDGCTLDVKLYEPHKCKSAQNLIQICSNEQEESGPHCTIEVRGVTKNMNHTTLELYFENKKHSGGDEIVKFEYREEKEIAYITYKTEEVAQRVVSHAQHEVEDQPLEVKLYIPPPPRPTYEDRVLLAGLTSKVTRDGLSNFLEAKIGLVPTHFLVGEEEDKVIIRFGENIDFQKLEEACKKQALEGSHLQPSKVHVSNCILVLNLKITTTEKKIDLYFESEKWSCGGPVKKVEFNRDEEYCLVYFEDPTICDRVLQQKHEIDGSELQVSMHYECLGRISEDVNGPCFKPPMPVKLEGLEFAKVQFLMKSEPNRTALQKKLQDCFTQIQWPQTEADCMTLTCTLTSDVQDCKKKALTWAKQAEQNLYDFLKVISIHEIGVFQEVFEPVLQKLQNLVIANPDGVALFVKSAEFSIQVVGHNDVATVVVKDIEGIIKAAEADFDRKKKQTKVSLTNLKYHQLRLLLAQNYPSKMEQQFNGLKVKINHNENEIVFEGLMKDIRIAQVAMYESLQSVVVLQRKNIPEGCLYMYKSKEVKDYIFAKLKSKELVGVWEVEGTDLNIYADSQEAVKQSADIILDSVKEHQKDLEALHKPVVKSQQWNEKMTDLNKQYWGKINIVLEQDCSKLSFYLTDDILGAVMEEVTDFLSQNTILEKLVTCRSGTIQLIERRNKDELDKIAKDLAHSYVQINSKSKGGFLIWGNQDGIIQATFRLQELIDQVKHCKHELQKPGIFGYMEGKGKEHIATVENQISCVIQIRGPEQYGSRENEEDRDSFVNMGTSGPVIQAECELFSGEKIFTLLGDITETDVDVLVNAADPKLEHQEGLAKALVDKGGALIREECTQHTRTNGHLSEGEIHVTSAGNLRAEIIIHAVSPVWKNGHSNEDEVLGKTILKCMKTATENDFKSIAIPALGTGNFGFPVKLSTRIISDAVRDFFQENQESSISHVYLCDINPLTVRCFTEALEKSFGKQRVSDVKQKPSPGSPRSKEASQPPGSFAEIPSMPSNIEPENISIKVVKGEMASQRADVIVNTVSKSLDLTQGTVSQSLLKHGGQTLQDECKIKYPNGIKDGDIAVTGGGNLTCQMVCHVALALPSDAATSKKMINEVMKKCLDQCEKKGFTSIAFPALGTGALHYPKDTVAKEMFQHISTYRRENPSSSVKEVRFVVYHKDLQTIKAFKSEQQIWSSSGTRVGTQTGPHSLQPEISVENNMMLSMKSGESSGFGNISIKVVKGDMASQKVDVIVSTVSKSLDLTHGAVSQSLLKQGGQILQDDCTMNYPNGIKDGDIAVTRGGNLTCQIVCHGALAQWNDATACKKLLHGLMKKCLDECEKGGFTSIAFPALGTGNLNYPRDIVAMEMFKHIATYSRNNPFSSVREVRFLVYHKDLPTVQAFDSEQQKWSISGTRAGTWTGKCSQTEESSSYSTQPTDFAFGKICVKIYEGDITEDAADCIVNSSNEDLDLSKGAVSKAIMNKGGKPLADECRAKADEMKKDGIAVTKGYGLNCKHVIHIPAVDEQQWTEVIHTCLLKAEQLKAKSVALPAFGTGLGVSTEKSASIMFKAITDYETYGAGVVTEVHVVIFQSQMVQVFVDAARSFSSGAKPKPTRGRTFTTLQGGSDERNPTKEPLKSLQMKSSVRQPTTIWIDVYAWDKQSLEAAINKLNDLIGNDFKKSDFTESVVKKFSEDQVSKIQRLVQQWGIELTMDIKNGRITIEGVPDGILKVSEEIHKLMREVDKKEQDKKNAELLKKLVQWHYIEITTESSELREYPADVNQVIESAYKDQNPFVTFFTNDGEKYQIDFNKMEEFSVKDPSDTVMVVRKDLIQEISVFELPLAWTMAPNENLRVVNLQITDKEYQDVKIKFLQSVGGSRNVVKIERIQNRTLYQQYEAKKKLIEQNNPGHQNESSLWHGTSADTVDSISMHGFNRSYCGKNATAYGDGVYFAKNASYSANDKYSHPDPNGKKKMYLCRVLTGKYTTGNHGMRVPPSKPGGNVNDLYDSVVDNSSNPEIFVIFNDTQAIPEYLITFS